jgi:predicted DNA-binding protein (UPF0251 family)
MACATCNCEPTQTEPNLRIEILRMVNSGKTRAAEAARLFGLRRSSISRLISQARAEEAVVVG